MMTANEIRQTFLDFFAGKSHKIVPSAPLVNKDDPSLMFINAGMNPFKDFFLGNAVPDNPRIADTQKCLRVSGKHNDLEEVGIDSYHHTLFEMLGNWSIGDYFKKEAILWAWELLTEKYELPKDRLYVTIFEGDSSEKLDRDVEAYTLWESFVEPDKILNGNKKDNFWEMGDTGPCGPCSEIHVDLRSDAERKKQSGAELVNQDHPLVIEIWNLVFIQFNRKADGSLESLPDKHVDTGMGFERLCMAIQGKTSNYDTDVFTPCIASIEKITSKPYTSSYDLSAKSDIAMRVVADHLRAVAFAITDGALPSNTGAGYVIRRILRRAVRYYYSFLDWQEPLLEKLIPQLAESFKGVFPELTEQLDFVRKVVREEEKSFLRTLARGLERIDGLEVENNRLDGKVAFELYDTYGFPFDLTRLIAQEKGWSLDEAGFNAALLEQKTRARADAQKTVGDWTVLTDDNEVLFVGYDHLTVNNAVAIKYREVEEKKKKKYQIVLNETPFYAESGGQRGDRGTLTFGSETIRVLDTQKENNLIIHQVDKLPQDWTRPITAQVDVKRRKATSGHHSAVHLMHAGLQEILGTHATQRGQDLDDKRLRFDFSHFQKVTDEELAQLEQMVNEKIYADIPGEVQDGLTIDEAKAAGALMLFGEKYGDSVRMVTFDPNFSRELCGGTHVTSTGQIGSFKIIGESSVAAGVRRIEAVAGPQANAYIKAELETLEEIKGLFKNAKNLPQQVAQLQEQNKELQAQIDTMHQQQAMAMKGDLAAAAKTFPSGKLLVKQLPLDDAGAIKTLLVNIERELGPAVLVVGAVINEKPQLTILISKALTSKEGLHAGNLVRNYAKLIRGGGGGQPFFATAGGSDASGLGDALAQAEKDLGNLLG